MRILITFVLLHAFGEAACVTVPSNRILAQDLAKAVPLFQTLDSEDFIGYAPFPGMVRVLTSRDILLAARRYGLSFPAGETAPSVCVERAVHPLDIDELKAALVSGLDLPGAKIEVLEFSHQRVPPGKLEFSRASLGHPPGNNPQTAVIWQGRLIYDDHQTLGVWARVRISIDREMPVARVTISKGAVIRAEQVATARVLEFPVFDQSKPSVPPAGKMALRTIPAGDPIVAEALEDPEDVMLGETVRVRVTDGAATVLLDGIAQASGRKGDVIVVHNPVSGRNFRAVVEGPRKVIVRGEL